MAREALTDRARPARYLRLVEGALRILTPRRRFRFLVIGIDDYRLQGVDVERCLWRSETEVEDLWSANVVVGVESHRLAEFEAHRVGALLEGLRP